MLVELGRNTDHDYWWVHVNGKSVGCYWTRLGGWLAARRLAKYMGLKPCIPAEPYSYAFGWMIPIRAWGKPHG